MFLDIWPDRFNIVHLNVTFTLKIRCKVLKVSFANGNNSLFDYQNGLFIEWPNSPVSENQRKDMWDRLVDFLSNTHIKYNLTSETGFNCESLISYIKTGKKHFSEVSNLVVQNPVRGPIIFSITNEVAFLIHAFNVIKIKLLLLIAIVEFIVIFYDCSNFK